MNILVYLRMTLLSFFTFLPTLSNYWTLIIYDDIFIKNYKIKNPADVSWYASYFISAFLYGCIVGTIIWPIIVKKIPKKDSLLIGLLI